MASAGPSKIRRNEKVRCALFLLLATLSAVFLSSVCSAQEVEDPAPVVENKQLEVNWLYGAYIPKDAPMTPMTLSNRLRLYEMQTFRTPGLYVKSNFLGLLNQAQGKPEEWGGGMGGYSKRVASSYGQAFIQNSLSAAGNALLRYEPRYDRCHCVGLWPRTRHALLRNFLTYDRTEEQLHPQLGLYGAAFAAGMISSTWEPRTGVWAQGFRGVQTQAAFGMLSNWFGEFSPDIARVLKRRRHKPED